MKVAVLGGGAFGTALGCVAVNAGQDVVLWARNSATVAAINTSHSNPDYLPDVILPATLMATGNLEQALLGSNSVLVATPAQSTRVFLNSIKNYMPKNATVVLCAKGIEADTGAFLSDIAKTVLPDQHIAVLSGPGFARDIASGLPTAVTLAADRIERAIALSQTLSSKRFRIYASHDVRGVEAGGALKNIFAIAAGAVYGAKLGASASAALVTRGFAELKRIGQALGAKPETLNGLSGLGDLILTCNSAQSRNFQYGVGLARNEAAYGLAEGVATAHIACKIADEHGIDAPIIAAISALIKGQTNIDEAVDALMARPLKEE